jgi:hypothetical protein
MITCPLCGNNFEESARTLCSACPLGAKCNLICCPRCGYQWPAESATVNFIKKLFGKKEIANE